MTFHSISSFADISYESCPARIDEQTIAKLVRYRDELKRERSQTWVGLSLGMPMTLVGILGLNSVIRNLVEPKHVELIPLLISMVIGVLGFTFLRAVCANRQERKALDKVIQSPDSYKVAVASMTRLGVRMSGTTSTRRVFYQDADGHEGRSPHIWVGVLLALPLSGREILYAFSPGEKATVFLGFIVPATGTHSSRPDDLCGEKTR